MTESVSQRRIASALGVTTREIYNLRQKGLPSRGEDGRITYPLDDCVQWYVRYKEDLARGNKPIDAAEVEAARNARIIAESKMAELDLAEREGRVVAAEHVDEVVAEIGERVRAVLINMPSTYVVDLEKLGVSPAEGEAVLEKIAGDLTAALRGEDEEGDTDAADRAA